MWWKKPEPTYSVAMVERLMGLLQSEMARQREDLNMETELARDALQLAMAAVAMLPEEKQKAEINKDQPYKPRTMSAWCTALSERSYKRALSKGKNLVADMPPPGAQKPNGVA